MFRNIAMVPRLVGTVLAGGALIGVTTFAVLYQTISNGFATAEQRELEAVYQNISAEIDALGKQALSASALVAELPMVQQALERQDREALVTEFVPGFSTMKQTYGVQQFQFHLPPATSFLRVHKPAKFGDDLSGFRKTVLQANNTSTPVYGLEIGVAGLGVRGVVPVRNGTRHLGTVELGMSFNQTFFDDYANRHQIGIALHLLRNGQLQAFASTFKGGAPLGVDALRKVVNGETGRASTQIDNLPYSVYADVIKDFSGNVIGVLQVAKDRSFFVDQLSSIWKTTLVIGVIGLLLFGVGIWAIGKKIVDPLLQATGMMREISAGEGNLDVALDVSGKDEVAQLAKGFNGFVQTIRELVGEVNRTATQIDQAAGSLAESSAQAAERTARQQMETTQIATAMTEMSSTVQEVAKSTAEVASTAETALHTVGDGNDALQDASTSVNTLAADLESASSTVQAVHNESERIGTVLDVIRGIAEQTNLLALNAAIEAARAGEQGRGFAVVADEVRQLAHRTQESTSEIQEMVESLQNSVSETVSVMGRSRERADNTVQRTQRVTDTLASISSAVNDISQMTVQIATAAEEQSQVAEDINRNVISINQMAEANANDVAQSSNASGALSHSIDGLVALVSRFKMKA